MQKRALLFTNSADADSGSRTLAKRPLGRRSPSPKKVVPAPAVPSIPPNSLTVIDFASHAEAWLIECEFRSISERTIAKYRVIKDNLLWFLADQKLDHCGKTELQQFFLYLRRGHEQPGGRWGNPHNRRPVSSGTVATYHTVLRTLFRYLAAEGALTVSPMETLPRPIHRPDQTQPFTNEQVQALLVAARGTPMRRRDEAIILLLLDTGMRASELCGLTFGSINFTGRCCTVQGKGGKQRVVYFCPQTARTLWAHLRDVVRQIAEQEDTGNPPPVAPGVGSTVPRVGKKRKTASSPSTVISATTLLDTVSADTPVFSSDRGIGSGRAMTRSGLLQLIHRFGKTAGIETVRCSPHTFRHTFAIEFLRGGGNVFSLKELLGHTSLAIVNRYVALSQADLERQHRQCSPVANMKRNAATQQSPRPR